MSRLILATLAAVALAFGASGCDDPCADLERRVCEPGDQSLERDYKTHCELMQEPDRRENLPASTCESILDHIDRLER